MTINEPQTCGKGLAERSAFPDRVGALTAAMVDVLDTHQQTLDLADDNARVELTAYQQLAHDYRRLTSQLRATAERMLGYRDLPMARHHAQPMLAHGDPRNAREPRGTRARTRGAPEDMDRGGSGDAPRVAGVTMS